MVKRCNWGETENEKYREYHDHEWGKLNLDEKYLYEMLVLETFQSGLSWSTILNKRENFRKAFADFDYEKVAKYSYNEFFDLMHDQGIVRNVKKVDAAITDAKAIVALHKQGTSLGELLKQLVPDPIINHPKTDQDVPSQTELSEKIAKVLKEKGFEMLGPVTVYSFLQAVGLVNDHLDDCSFK